MFSYPLMTSANDFVNGWLVTLTQKACVSTIQIMSTGLAGQDGCNFILHLMAVV